MKRAFGLITGLLFAAGALSPARADFSFTSTITSGGLPLILPTSDPTQGGVLSLVSNSGSPTGNSSTVNLAYVYTTGLHSTANFSGSIGYDDTATFTAGGHTVTWDIKGDFAAANSTYTQSSMNLVHTFDSATSFTQTYGDGTILSLTGVTMSYPSTPNGPTDTSGQAGVLQGVFTLVQGTGPGDGNPGGNPGGSNPGGSNPGTTVQTPEPSTMLLAGMGLSAVGAAAWRKRRKLVAAGSTLQLA